MFHFDFPYVLINILLLTTLWYAGYKISKGHAFWKYAVFAMIAFTLVEGARYGRGVDYMHYVDVYNYNLEKSQVLFTAFNDVLKKIGVTSNYCFMVYAFFFIAGAMFLFKPMRKYASYILPFFLLSIISFHEAFIRQFFAMSFIFLYIYILNEMIVKKKRARVVLLALTFYIAYSIHSISAITILLITILFLFFKKPFSWKITIPALLIGKFILANTFDWSYLDSLFNFIASTDSKMAGYASNSSRYFSIEAANLNYTRNFFVEILEVFGCCSALYLGSKVLNSITAVRTTCFEEKKETGQNLIYVTLFNTFVFGCLMLETFYNLELTRRVSYGWYIYWFVPVALVLYHREEFHRRLDKFFIMGFAFWLWEYIRFLFVWGSRPLFLWDI